MNSISPVFTESEVSSELVIALDQKEYYPLIGLPVRYEGGETGMAFRFEFSPAEREMIAKGGNLIISELTFGSSVTPIALAIQMPNTLPEFK